MVVVVSFVVVVVFFCFALVSSRTAVATSLFSSFSIMTASLDFLALLVVRTTSSVVAASVAMFSFRSTVFSIFVVGAVEGNSGFS